MRTWFGTASCVMIAVCGSTGIGVGTAGASPSRPSLDWRRVATTADRARLRSWREAWVNALAQVDPREVTGDPVLFDPDRSLVDPLPPSGAYRCRTYKLGARAGIGPTFTRSGWFACRFGASDDDGDDSDDDGESVVSLVKLDGSQRPVGTVFADTDFRAVFLGTMELGDEKRPMRYGRDANRDMAGLIERIGTERWRVVLPYPRFESVLDVVELVPAS
ncbi:DUF4893 domain-containing protein [Sphingomonas sp. PP-CE-1G-424]|uniref:DUF4893 domain-containing protein n=1 Tax=Sphingomonas sp. PP-CE-1G-424 TaxID=2135658 RepID=UPI001054D0D6|nr:DUF4893 domain-containing protein [Sphingomonas sp. PP-CE-1G-424]TCP71767.1 uncharacterized protein DUF4893 [Sphingomonas sp. PP-CE-1G-424]